MKKILFLLVLLIGFFANGQTPVVDGVQYAKHYSTAEMNAIPSPANGRYIYNSDTNSLWRFDGSVWAETSGSGGSGTVAFSTITGSPHDNANLGQSLDSTVHKWGNETIDSVKTFLRTPNITPRLVTVAAKNTHYDIIKLNGNPFLTWQSQYWNGSAFVSASANGGGIGAISNNKARYVTGFGKNAAQNNTGESAAGFGDSALTNNTGEYTIGFGFSSGLDNSGSNGTFGGSYSGRTNTATDVTGLGFYSAANNTGTFSTFTGSRSGQFNSGNISTGTGFYSLLYNAGLNSNGFGYYALNRNNGDRNNGFGNYTLQYAKGTDNNVFGNSSYSEFIPNISGNKTFGTSDVNTGTDQITVTAHSFGTIGAVVNLKLSGAGVYLGTGMGDGSVNKWEVIDANTLKAKFVDITSTGTGTMTLTPQFAYSNVNILGNNLQPTQSDQTILGGATVVGPNTNKAAGIAGGNKVFLTREMGDQLYTGGGGGGTITLPLDATDIADGSVTNTEFQYMNTVTSNVQTQLDGKLDPTDILDEDNMASNSDTHVPSQQSVKAYADTKLTIEGSATPFQGSIVTYVTGTRVASNDYAKIGNGSIRLTNSDNGGYSSLYSNGLSLNSVSNIQHWFIGNKQGYTSTVKDSTYIGIYPKSGFDSGAFEYDYTDNRWEIEGFPIITSNNIATNGGVSTEQSERISNAGKYHFTSTASNETLTSALVEPATPNLGKKMWRTYTANDTITVPGDLTVGWSSVIEAGSATDSILIKADTGVDIYGRGNVLVQSGTGIDGLWLKGGDAVALIYKGANSVRAEGPWNVATLAPPPPTNLYTTSNAVSLVSEANTTTGTTVDTGSTLISTTTGSPPDGTYCFKLTEDVAGDGGLAYINRPSGLTAGTYDIKIKCSYTGSGVGNGFFTSTGDEWSALTFATITNLTGTWVEYTLSGVVLNSIADSESGRIRLYLDSGTRGTPDSIFFDSVTWTVH